MSTLYLSIIIPAYNESKRIGDTLRSLASYFQHANYYYEIIVVNDGSTDSTFAVLQNLQTEISQLKIINNPKNMGKGYAVKCGMQAATGDLRLFMDADNSVKINEVEIFLSKTAEGFDVVIGSIGLDKKDVRMVSENNGYYRRPIGLFSKYITRIFATPGIYDTQRGFKLFTKKAVDVIFPKLSVNRFGFDIELLVVAQINNLKIKELPVEFNNPKGSTVNLMSYVVTFFELLKIVIKKHLGRYSKNDPI